MRLRRLSVPGPVLLVLLLSLSAGVAAALGAHGYLKGKVRQIEQQHQQPQVERIVAAYNLAAGTTIEAALLAVRKFPADLVPSGSMAPVQATELLGKELLSDLQVGDIIVRVHAREAGAGTFSQHVAKGRRALTMPVDAINSASGLLAPGDMIDLYVSFEHQRRRITAPLLQGVKVLATGNDTVAWGQAGADVSAQNYGTITLDTSPEDAVKLVAARQSGTITAMLRSPLDDGASQKAMRGDLASLLGLGAVDAPVKEPRNAVVIYGNRSIREVPALSNRPAVPGPEQGVFDLSVPIQLSSNILQSLEAGALPYLPGAGDAANRGRHE